MEKGGRCPALQVPHSNGAAAAVHQSLSCGPRRAYAGLTRAMTTYHIFYLREAVLVDCEVRESSDLVETVLDVSVKAPEQTVEIWSNEKKVAIIRPRIA
jgi:hypothetical protein